MAAKKPQSKNTTKSPTWPASRARLRGKVAVVTGGSRGIGYAIARTLALEGCNVVITGRDPAALSKSAARIAKSASSEPRPPQIVPIACDIRDPDSVASLFTEIRKRFGKLDILVNNAGITQPILSVENTSLELWRDVIDTNLTSVFLCVRAALPLMKAGGDHRQ
jgi:NAD(P)-dependent dehydrogenase (short-subunit alcohol dehydrogenase family)